MTTTSVSCFEIAPYVGHEFVHRRAAVVAGDVIVQVLPDAFDPIVVRAVWRQEVQLQFFGRGRLHCQPHLQTVVDTIVVEDEMNPLGVGIDLRGQRVEQFQEQQAVLPLAFDINERVLGFQAPAR